MSDAAGSEPPVDERRSRSSRADGDGSDALIRRDTWVIGLVGLVVRAAIAAWAAPLFPPAADGTYYHLIADRIARGLGYTWLWPDGAVTYAAHYPVGYPAIIGALYAVFGARPGVAMAANAVIGALAAIAVHRLAARGGSRKVAAIAGLMVALHPGLVAYTPAIMTEAVTASLLACSAWAISSARVRLERADGRRAVAFTIAAGALMGAATLVRPQSIVIAPLFAIIVWAGPSRSARASALAASACVAAALLVCAPWTARNCVRMKSCALVSVNGGWNLLIGADEASTGAWSPIKVPAACLSVFDEAEKDACFGREARRYISEHPAAWLALAPRKLAATFDYIGAAGSYLEASNREAFSEKKKLAIGVVEMVFERVALLLALAWAARSLLLERGRRSARAIIGAALSAIGAVFLVLTHAWVSYVAFAIVALLRGPSLLRGPVLGGAAVSVLIATIVTHAAVFGAGRYALPVFPLLCGVAALAFDAPSTLRARL